MQANHPPKEVVREHLRARRVAAMVSPRQPLPSPEQIRRELGWGLVQPERK